MPCRTQGTRSLNNTAPVTGAQVPCVRPCHDYNIEMSSPRPLSSESNKPMDHPLCSSISSSSTPKSTRAVSLCVHHRREWKKSTRTPSLCVFAYTAVSEGSRSTWYIFACTAVGIRYSSSRGIRREDAQHQRARSCSPSHLLPSPEPSPFRPKPVRALPLRTLPPEPEFRRKIDNSSNDKFHAGAT